jgi:hypothetical protein
MDLSGHFKDKEEEEEEECSHYLATFTSDGDIIMISFGRYTFERANYVTLKIFDINKNVVKKRQDIDEQLFHDYGFSYEVSSDKICLIVTNLGEQNVGYIFNKELEMIKKTYLDYSYFLIGANDSFIFFWSEKSKKRKELLVFNWQLEKEIREIDKKWQNANPALPFYISYQASKFQHKFGRYYFEERGILRIVDETTGLLINKIESHDFNFNFFVSQIGHYLIMIYKESIKFSDLDGKNNWRELKLTENFISSDWILNKDNQLISSLIIVRIPNCQSLRKFNVRLII